MAKYLPFVQDFVKSREWGKVGDLQNTGLRQASSRYTPEDAQRLLAQHRRQLDLQSYLTAKEQQELDDLLGFKDLQVQPPDDYAQGGSVQPSAFMQRAQAMLAGR